MKISWPENKSFAFTIVDDTDNGTVENLRPVYDLLYQNGLRTTKTVWVYPPRDNFTGQCLLDNSYENFIKQLHQLGFEIALHNVGSGHFTRDEILVGLETFNEIMGFYPTMQINHASNPDNIYWGITRYTKVLSALMELIYGERRSYYGTDPNSDHFWGDISKGHFKYIRNHTFNGIDTLRYDPKMPYRVAAKDEYSNYWFSSSDAHTVKEFNALTMPEKVKRLVRRSGLCIVYTHFAYGFVDSEGNLDTTFRDNIQFLSEQNGWFAPASEILDYLRRQTTVDNEYASYLYRVRLDFLWILDRLQKKIKYGK